MVDDYDSPWKEAIERYFADFLHFYFPHTYAHVDWNRQPVFLDQELRALCREAYVGKRFVDKLVRVNWHSGQEEWIYLHIEVQGDAQDTFAERMFVYHYRLYDRYRRPIVSLAVLADDRTRWRPDCFRYEAEGCELRLRFPVAKLLDWAGREAQLSDSRNPFAVVTHAHLATRATRGDAAARYAAKWALVRSLYQRGWGKQQVIDLFNIIDWMMQLPNPWEQQLGKALEHLEEEIRMPYVSTIERLAIERGLEKGMQQGLEKGLQQGMQQGMQQGRHEGLQQGLLEGKLQALRRLLSRRFGELPGWVEIRLQQAGEAELDAWMDALLSAASIEALFGPSPH